jgi:hypothetical protein
MSEQQEMKMADQEQQPLEGTIEEARRADPENWWRLHVETIEGMRNIIGPAMKQLHELGLNDLDIARMFRWLAESIEKKMGGWAAGTF